MRAVVALVAVAVLAPGAHADAPDARARAALASGERLFADQEYRRAIKVLIGVTRDAAAPRALRVRAWELIALARYIDGDLGGARDAFERLLEADPGFQLRDTSGSPRIRRFFDQVRAEVVPAAAAAEVDLEHAAPRAATAGGRVELEARVTRGLPEVRAVAILYRRLGALRYDEQVARPVADDRYRATVRLPAARRGYVLEYFVEARGPAGAVIARVAGPDAPLSLRIDPGGERGRPWYGRWYVIAGAAALAAGATGAAVWVATDGDVPDGSLPPGRITVTP
ncbi:MAG: hypothetical protein KBG48_07095 [Kofleriaceae bacterium]|jgi:tetratricopeptide (TPR) repeat protein|nr:hypothetical protein [Kofleriaceae bacterium]MBP9167135.1 hypothetical protein [Kofleriaceae bacterium]MBP9860962.1 hypothetical protein [Kofleriaceae bacterium]